MSFNWKCWRHLVKLDPARVLPPGAQEVISRCGTDGVVIGGSAGITSANVGRLVKVLRDWDMPVFQEVSTIESIVPGCDGYLIPVVLNAGDVEWIVGAHRKALVQYSQWVDWSKVLIQGYIILNQDSTAARVTQSYPVSSIDDLLAYAQVAENILGLPVLYLEYSGRYGDPSWIKAVKCQIKKARLFYGGGINSSEKAAEMGEYADTIVVGNMIYEGGLDKLTRTVLSVKENVEK
ncbi:MAG: geranylgeranylglyceryl/heptaprenylglyceryl phosphate synthase [Bacillota bacterium]